MLTFPSKLLLANSPKDTVDFGRRHEEIREHELKLYQVSVDHAYCTMYVHSSTTTKFSRSTHGSTKFSTTAVLTIPYPGYGIRRIDI